MKVKKSLPPKTKDYLNLVKTCYKAGFKPLQKAMQEASRRWKVLKNK